MKQITLNLDSNDLRDKIKQLRALTFRLDNIQSIAGQEASSLEVSKLNAEELGESISAVLETEHGYTELLDGLANVLEEALYEPKPQTGPTF